MPLGFFLLPVTISSRLGTSPCLYAEFIAPLYPVMQTDVITSCFLESVHGLRWDEVGLTGQQQYILKMQNLHRVFCNEKFI